MSKNIHEVYMCYLACEVVYVGQGVKGRHKHCLSGTSHVYALNELHFKDNNKDMKVVVVASNLNKEDALLKERELIRSHKPMFNTVGLTDLRQDVATTMKTFRRVFKNSVVSKRVSQRDKDKLFASLEDFLSYHNYKVLVRKGLKLKSVDTYKSLGYNSLSLTVRNYLYKPEQVTKNYGSIFVEALEKAYEDVFGTRSSVTFPNTNRQE